jgi:hypothetical protein
MRDSRIKTYTFQVGDLTANNVSPNSGGNFCSYTSHALNGTLKGLYMYQNNYTLVGSMFLEISGLQNIETWKIISGTTTNNVGTSGGTVPLCWARTNNDNTILSGTNSIGVYSEISLFGVYRLVGSSIGTGKSGLGFTIVYI